MKRTIAVICMITLLSLILISSAIAATRMSSGNTVDSQLYCAVPVGISSQFNEQYSGNILDNNLYTVFSYTHWSSKATDDIPELSFSFNCNTISDIWIRNGDMSNRTEYFSNARAKQIDITVNTLNGTYIYSYLMDDRYDTTSENNDWNVGYQRCSLPFTVPDVYSIDLWIRSCFQGTKEKYNVSVSDILFTNSSRSSYTTSAPAINAGSVYVTLNQRLATRSGPSTNYDELGSYFSAGTEVKAISRAWDSRNDIWWVQVEFSYNGTMRRAYTGLKRLNMNVKRVPAEKIIYNGATVLHDSQTAWGPGENYAQHNNTVYAGTCGVIYSIERNYAQFEYNDGKLNHRVWIPITNLSY